jgi:hypothetical protein
MSKISYDTAVGSLMYLMTCTRPDISLAIGKVSRYMSNPSKVNWEAVKWILRSLKGTKIRLFIKSELSSVHFSNLN